MQTARSYGLIGTSTVTVPELRILNAKSDDAREDLRIGAPFAALREYVDALDLTTLGALEFGHVPYLVLLVKAMDAWRRSVAGGGGDEAAAAVRRCPEPASPRPSYTPLPPPCAYQKRRVPKTRAEKEAFKAVLRAMGEATGPLPANFSEALEAAQLAWVMEEVRPWESLHVRLAASRVRSVLPVACFGNA